MIDIHTFSGAAIVPHLDAVAALRIEVFRDWPYLYDGDAAYERGYLAAYANSPDSLFVLAFDGPELVGASTGMPLADEAPAFQHAFRQHAIAVDRVFYFGESVLLPAYRGQGAGHAFFDHREAHARRLGGFGWTAFAAIDRDPRDPRRPGDHRGHEALWRGRGYTRRPGLSMQLDWAEPGVGECSHALTFWTRPLESAA